MKHHHKFRGWFPVLLLIAGGAILLFSNLRASSTTGVSAAEMKSMFGGAAFWGSTTGAEWKGFPVIHARTDAAWGNMEKVRIELEPPPHSLEVPAVFWNPVPWVFEVDSKGQVRDIFARAGLTPKQLRSLCDPARLTGELGFFTVTPEPETLAGLSPESRSAIYYELAKCSLNPFHRAPFNMPREYLNGWLLDSGLDSGIQDKLRQMAYPRGSSVCFSDLHAFAGEDEATKQRILLTLSRAPSLTAKLRIDERSDIDALVRYWGEGGREREVRALLEAGAHVEGGSRIPVANLLPSFARTRLYTYPQRKLGSQKFGPNCFWTALNFFNDQAEEAGVDSGTFAQRLASGFVAAEGPLRLGDVIAIRRQNGSYLHACVFIADGIVFTKNGAAYSEPWTLQGLDDDIERYLLAQRPGSRVSFEVHRRRSAGSDLSTGPRQELHRETVGIRRTTILSGP